MYYNCEINDGEIDSGSDIYSDVESVKSLSEVNDNTEHAKAESSNANTQQNQESEPKMSTEKTEDCNQESSKDNGKGKAKEI
jgi:hypothetical protein